MWYEYWGAIAWRKPLVMPSPSNAVLVTPHLYATSDCVVCHTFAGAPSQRPKRSARQGVTGPAKRRNTAEHVAGGQQGQGPSQTRSRLSRGRQPATRFMESSPAAVPQPTRAFHLPLPLFPPSIAHTNVPNASLSEPLSMTAWTMYHSFALCDKKLLIGKCQSTERGCRSMQLWRCERRGLHPSIHGTRARTWCSQCL